MKRKRGSVPEVLVMSLVVVSVSPVMVMGDYDTCTVNGMLLSPNGGDLIGANHGDPLEGHERQH